MHRRLSNFFILLAIFCFFHPTMAQHPTRPRIIITADPELDDNNSLIRFLLYSSDFTVEGLVYASSQFHWKGDGKGTKWFVPGREYDRFGMGACPCTSWRWAENERFIHDIVEAYEKVYPNLKIHNANYPTPDYLKSKIRYGNIEFDGDFSKDTPGSILIRTAIMDDKPGQLFISAWGGHSTIARALKSIQDLYENTIEWEQIKKKIARKVVLLPSGDQDDTYISYIKPYWPEIEYRQFREGPNYGYGAQIRANADNAGYLTPAWIKENVNDRGPLGTLYRVWGDGKQMVKGDKVDYFGLAGYTNEELKKMGYFVWMPVQEKGSWLGEGDNHTFMNMLGNGLRAYEKASFGGWGGRERAQKEELSLFAMPVEDNADSLAKRIEAANVQNSAIDTPYPNFFPQAQRDFAARMKWTVSKTYQEANHEPQVKIAGPLVLMVGKGQKVKLHAEVSDPDGQQVSVKWWPFYVGTYPSKVEILNANALNAEIVIPNNAVGGQTIHVILEASDNGSPALTRYQRVILVLAQR